MTYVDAQQIYDPDYPAGHRYYWKSTNLPSLPAEAVDVLVEHMRRAPSKHSTIDIWLNGGAIARVADDATAFSGRDGRYVDQPRGQLGGSGRRRRQRRLGARAARGPRASRERRRVPQLPRVPRGGPVARPREHGRELPRLAQLKQRLDPENLFRRNANIEPAA